MDEQRSEFKRRFASSLLGMRADSDFTSQKAIAAAMNKLTPMSEATYARWEKLNEPHLPDAYEIVVLAKLLGREPGRKHKRDRRRPHLLTRAEVTGARRS